MVWWRFHQGLKWAGRFVHRTGLRIAAKEAGAVAAVSEATRRDVLEYLGPSIDPARLTVIPNAAADEFGEIIPVDVRLAVRASPTDTLWQSEPWNRARISTGSSQHTAVYRLACSSPSV